MRSKSEPVIGRLAVTLLVVVALWTPVVTAAERPPDRFAVSDEAIRRQIPAGVRFIPNIKYQEGMGEAGLLDLAMPEDPGDGKLPAIVFVHGGGWQSGSKRRPLFILPALRYAGAGYVCITVNYRLAHEAPFPAAVEDVKTAVRWLRAHADSYQVDAKRIGAYGNSAGAHLALMAAMVGPEAGLEGDLYPGHSSAVQALCASAVPADFSVWVPEGTGPDRGPGTFLAGPEETVPERVAQASPISYVRADAPPMLLIHGTDDATVPVEPLDRFVEAMRSVGHKDLSYLRIEGAGHMVFQQHRDQTVPAMAEFFARTLGGGVP